MNNSLRLLRYDLASDLAMSVSEPVVCYRETVTRATAQVHPCTLNSQHKTRNPQIRNTKALPSRVAPAVSSCGG